jgi:hypothetical protein
MNNFKSHEFTFLYLINKCILLFKYIEINDKKNILYEIKLFINKLQEIFSKGDFKDSIEKKNKIFEILIQYFQKIIDEKIYNLIKDKNKDNIISHIERHALEICENNENKKETFSIKENLFDKIDTSVNFNKDKSNNDEYFKYNKFDEKNNGKFVDSINKNISMEDIEDKIQTKIKITFNEIESNIKSALKDYFSHTEYVEYDLDKKFNDKLNNVEKKIKDYLKDSLKDLLNNGLIKEYVNNSKIYDYIQGLLKVQIGDLYIYMESYIKNSIQSPALLENNIQNNIKTHIENYTQNYKNDITELNRDIKNNMKSEIESKILMLTTIFNNNMQSIINSINDKMIHNETELFKTVNEKISECAFNKHNFNINFDKETNEIKLYYFNELITSSKINIKGLIGPKGPSGNKGDKGDTPIIRKIGVQDGRLKFIIQDTGHIYELLTDENIPAGPPGIQGIRGEPGKSFIELKWDQENVMRIDKDHMDSLIFLKSLCVGEKSHCLKNNSIAIGGGICYNSDSFSIGNNSKTLDTESVAFYGSTIGKRAFAYRADNIDENIVCFGKKDKSNYDINDYRIISKEINFECDTFRIKTNNYENNKIKELEDKVSVLEKKVNEISKKI